MGGHTESNLIQLWFLVPTKTECNGFKWMGSSLYLLWRL